mgnify:FL=1
MTQSNISKKKKSSKLTINKGVELILGEKQKQKLNKPSKIKFEKTFSIFKRKIYFNFEFNFRIEK